MCTPRQSLCSCVLLVDRDRLLVVYWKILVPQRTRTGMAAASHLWCTMKMGHHGNPLPHPRGAPCVLKGWSRVPVAINFSSFVKVIYSEKNKASETKANLSFFGRKKNKVRQNLIFFRPNLVFFRPKKNKVRPDLNFL